MNDQLPAMVEHGEKLLVVVEAGRGAGVPLVVNARTDLYANRLFTVE